MAIAGLGGLGNAQWNPAWRAGASVVGARNQVAGRVLFVIGAGGLITRTMGIKMQEANKP